LVEPIWEAGDKVSADRRITVYIDETGDRGGSPSSSPIFGMAAVVVDDEGADRLRRVVDRLRLDFRVPTAQVMSWKAHVKNHDRRKRAADMLGELTHLRVCYVYSVKAELLAGSYRDHPQWFYHSTASAIYKSVLHAAQDWVGPQARVFTRFGHVRGHDHRSTEAYIWDEIQRDPRVPTHLEQRLRWVSADKFAESQAADLYGGFLRAALWPSGDFGYVEPSYLLRVWAQIHGSDQCVIPFGLRPMPDHAHLLRTHWFPCRTCPYDDKMQKGFREPPGADPLKESGGSTAGYPWQALESPS
jgi:hypothetical protein